MSNWKEESDKLVKSYEFKNFIEAWAFLQKVAFIAEKNQHHPEIENVYNKVKLSLCTHDIGSIITNKDRELARLIDELN